MKRILFKRILFSYLIAAALLIVALEFYLSGLIKTNYISKLKEGLAVQGRLIAEQIPLSAPHNLDDFCKKYKEKTGARITIIDRSGHVLGDSDESSKKMANHLDRHEVQQASINNIGSSIRFSDTLQKNFFYLAIALNDDVTRGFIRLSIPLHDMDEEISQIKTLIIFGSIAALLIAILFGLFQSKRLTKSIEEITAFSREIAEGNLERRLYMSKKDELGELGKNIGTMAQELSIRLKQSEEERYKTEAILKNMSDGLMLIDDGKRILLCNSAVKNFFGIESDTEGQTLLETFRNAELMEIISKAIESEEIISREIEVSHPRMLYLMATAVPFYSPHDKQKMTGVVLTFHDITGHKRVEEIRKDFVANVSHEIKTPITAIKGFAETLLEGAIDDRENALKFLRTIENHSVRLNSLVDDLLVLSGIESGEIMIEKQNVDISTLTDAVFTTLDTKANEKGLYLKKSLPSQTFEIYADKDRLFQILLNLVDNGIKFTESGGITVGIEKAGERNVLFVEDTGIGIEKKYLSRLGERFYRVDRSRSRELGGTGLGLAIVKHLMRAHGWNMQIESTPGKGTKVNILVT